MATINRRDFIVAASAGLTLAPELLAEDPAADVQASLAKRSQAVLVHTSWVRDPFIALGKDGWYYYTGTMQDPSVIENSAFLHTWSQRSASLERPAGSRIRASTGCSQHQSPLHYRFVTPADKVVRNSAPM
jgi:hypothetical protein